MDATPSGPGRSGVDPLTLARVVARGVGQVMFQGHAGTGLLFLAGIAVASPLLASGALIGAVIGPALAYALKFDRQEILDGIHGFNPTLVGIALLFYLKPVAATWGLLVVACAAATLLTYLMRRFLKFPTYTSPFILTTWAALFAAHAAFGHGIDSPPPAAPGPVGLAGAVLAGEAEVMFGANAVTGALFLVGIALSDWRQAVVALVGSVAGTLTGVYHRDPAATVAAGLDGYNASLAAMAVYLWRRSLLLPVLGAVVSVPLIEFFPKGLGVPPLTAPFVLATWILMAAGRLEGRFCND